MGRKLLKTRLGEPVITAKLMFFFTYLKLLQAYVTKFCNGGLHTLRKNCKHEHASWTSVSTLIHQSTLLLENKQDKCELVSYLKVPVPLWHITVNVVITLFKVVILSRRPNVLQNNRAVELIIRY